VYVQQQHGTQESAGSTAAQDQKLKSDTALDYEKRRIEPTAAAKGTEAKLIICGTVCTPDNIQFL
jgi:hypothetical protein